MKLLVLTPFRAPDEEAVRARRLELLAHTVASVDSQSFDLLHVIIDDGSPREMVRELNHRFSAKHRLILSRRKPPDEVPTCSGAINLAVEFALAGEFRRAGISDSSAVTVLHSDDLLINAHRRLEEMGRASLLYSDAGVLVERTQQIWHWRSMHSSPAMLRRWFWILSRLPYPTLTWRLCFLRSIQQFVLAKYEQMGVMDERVGCGEDVDVALSSLECLCAERGVLKRVTDITAIYRIHDDSLAATRPLAGRNAEEHFILEKHFGDLARFQKIARFFARPETAIPALWRLKLFFGRPITLDLNFETRPS